MTREPETPQTPQEDVDTAIGGALMEIDHLSGFARRGPRFRAALAEMGWALVPVTGEAAAAPGAALDARPLVAELLGQIGFLRSCIASGERLDATDIDGLDRLRDRVREYQRLGATPDPLAAGEPE